jgi:DNA-binding IclR family transcriptional regulator
MPESARMDGGGVTKTGLLQDVEERDAPDDVPPSGARSVERALRLLKELSSRGEFGWRLSDLSEQVGLDRATCHRMLACFVAEGFAERRSEDLRYYPGHVLFEMGLAVPQYAALRELVSPRLEHLARRSGCIASFALRSGNDIVCICQERGKLEIAGMLIRVGTRRPLVTSVAGLAILQQLAPEVAARIVAENMQREFGRAGARRIEKLERMRRRSDARGYGFTIGDLAPGIGAVAVAVRAAGGEPFAALFVTGQDTVVNEGSAGRLHELVSKEAARIEADAGRCLGKAKFTE